MTETLMRIDPMQRTGRSRAHTIDPAAGEIVEGLEWLKMMQVHAGGLQTASEEWLASRVMDPDGRSVVHVDEFGGSRRARRALHLTIGKVGRSPHRDPLELNKTTLKVASVTSRLDRSNIAYMKTRSETPGKEPQYALGKIIRTLIAVEPDHPKKPIRNRVVMYTHTRSLLAPDGIKVSKLIVDDIAAQVDTKHGDTGPNTPFVAVGKRALRKVVRRAYQEPRTERNARGNDSRDILAALNESDTRLTDLGFDEAYIDQQGPRAVAGLKRVRDRGATYNHEILMLAPACDSLDEAIEIIDEICGDRAVDDIHPELGNDYRLLAALRTR